MIVFIQRTVVIKTYDLIEKLTAFGVTRSIVQCMHQFVYIVIVVMKGKLETIPSHFRLICHNTYYLQYNTNSNNIHCYTLQRNNHYGIASYDNIT